VDFEVLGNSIEGCPGEDLVSAEVGAEEEGEARMGFDAVGVGVFLLGRVVVVMP